MTEMQISEVEQLLTDVAEKRLIHPKRMERLLVHTAKLNMYLQQQIEDQAWKYDDLRQTISLLRGILAAVLADPRPDILAQAQEVLDESPEYAEELEIVEEL